MTLPNHFKHILIKHQIKKMIKIFHIIILVYFKTQKIQITSTPNKNKPNKPIKSS